MKVPQDEPKVRAIPIEDANGGLFPDTDESSRSQTGRVLGPRLRLAISGIAITTLVAAAALFGAGEFQDAPVGKPEAFSPTTTVSEEALSDANRAPSLEETIPGTTDRLTLLTTDRHAIWTLLWDPSSRSPNRSLTISDSGTNWTSASFDAGRRFVAALGALQGEQGARGARIGSPSTIEPASLLPDVWSLKWHATDVGRLSTAHAVEDEFLIEAVDIDFLTKEPKEVDVLFSLDEAPRIVRWDNKGFVMQLGDRTLALDDLGNEIWSADGWAHTASPEIVSQVRRTETGVRWFAIDRETGESTSFREFGINNDALVTEIVMSPSSNIFAAVTQRKDAVTITVGGFSLIVPKTVYLFEDVLPYEFTSDTALFILRSSDSNDLTFFDWRQGTFHRLEVPDENRVLAINMG
jgi:hypothetical protein